MNENEMLQMILSEIKSMNGEIKSINGEIKSINDRLDTLEEGQKSMRADIEDLKEGQKAIRRDVARVDRKIDRLSADVGDTLVYVTDSVGSELEMLKKAK